MSDEAAKEPAKAKEPKAKKEPATKAVEVTASALVAKFKSHGQEYTILRVSRDVGEKLTRGQRYDIASAGKTLTLTPAKTAK